MRVQAIADGGGVCGVGAVGGSDGIVALLFEGVDDFEDVFEWFGRLSVSG